MNLPFHRLFVFALSLLFSTLAFGQSQYNVYYGDLHSHTWYSDGNQDQTNHTTYNTPVARAITYARTNANSMNFLGVSEHNHSQAGMSAGNWANAKIEAAANNQDNVFVGMLGQEWGVISGGGHVLVYGTDKLFGWESGVYDVYVAKSVYTQLWDSVYAYGGFCYLAHPQSGDYNNLFSSAYNAKADSVIQGCAVKSGPSTSSNTAETDPASGNYESRYHDLLRIGYHVAPCGNQDNHNTTYGRANQQRTAVLATSLTQANILAGLRARHAYCTEDHNLEVRLECGTNIMGDIITVAGTPNIRVKVSDPDAGETVSSIVLRYGVPGSGTAPTQLTAVSNVDSLIYTTNQTVGTTNYYYAYVTMSNGMHAWSAPIWVTRASGTPPSAFNLTSPANGSVDQALAGTLSWATSTNATGYDVYLGTTNPPTTLVSSNQAGTTYSYSGLLTNKTYYWKVTARNTSGTLDATGSPYNFATVKPLFAVTPSSIAFGTVYVGLTKRDSVTVSNAGSMTLSIDSVRSDNARFTLSPTSASVAAGGSQKFYITFTPTVTTAQSGTIRFYHNATGSPSTVSVTGSGATYTITSSTHAGGIISPSGSVGVGYGSSQSFTVTPSTGYHVDSVVVDGTNAGALTSYTFSNVTANHSISAWFSINKYSISSSAGANGSISPLGTTTVNYGDSVTYTITADGGYTISNVVVDGISVGAVSTYKFRAVSANHSIIASFGVPGTFSITAITSGSGTISPSGSVSVTQGQNASFTIAPSSGYRIDSVQVDGAYAGAVTSYTFTNVQANHTIRAVFKAITYTITASATSGGTIAPSGAVTVMQGTDTTFNFTPSYGWVIDSLFVDGSSVPVQASYTFSNVTAAHTISVKFRHLTYTIASSASGNGAISPSGSVIVGYGDNATFTLTPNTGSYIDSLVVDGSAIASTASYTFTGVTANHTIAVYYGTTMFTVTAVAGAHGSVFPSGSVQFPYGTDTTYRFTADTGYTVSSLSIDNVSVPPASSYRFASLTADHDLMVGFTPAEYILTVTVTGGGSVARSPELDTYTYGSNVTLTAVPAFGYRFAGWSEDFTSADSALGITINGAHHVTATFEPIPLFRTSAAALDFGSVAVDQKSTINLVIANPGAAALSISSMGASKPEYTVSPSSITVAAGDSAAIQVSFTPSALGAVTDALTIVHSADGSPESIALSGSGVNAVVSVPLAARWNLISNPMTTESGDVQSLYPTSTFSFAYGYNGSGYAQSTALGNGNGYWGKFPGTATAVISGLPIHRDTVHVLAGWNLVGSISSPISAASLEAMGTSITSSVFGYASGYQVCDTIQPGKGYWVRVDAEGDLILARPVAAKTMPKSVSSASLFANMNPVSIGDAAGNTQTLYLVAAGTVDNNAGRYALPPLPPQGLFDARFASQSLVEEYHTDAVKQQYRITLSSATFPVSIHVSAAGMKQQILVRNDAGKVLATVKAGQESDVRVTDENTGSVTLVLLGTPKEYALLQNYPNPFNPVSNIQFELPAANRVVLNIYNVLGQQVQTLLNGDVQDAGFHQVEFNGADLASGIYFYRLDATNVADGKNFSKMLKMALIK